MNTFVAPINQSRCYLFQALSGACKLESVLALMYTGRSLSIREQCCLDLGQSISSNQRSPSKDTFWGMEEVVEDHSLPFLVVALALCGETSCSQ